MQQGEQTDATCNIQQCCFRLHLPEVTRVTSINFLLTLSTHHQEKMLRELMK